MKHAFMVLAHHRFGQLKLLLRLLDHTDNDIYLHIDKKAISPTDESLQSQVKHSTMRIYRQVSVIWGKTQVDAILFLLKQATQTEHGFYHLISGQDLPIKPMRDIHAFFESHQGKEFVHANPPGQPRDWFASLRRKSGRLWNQSLEFRKGETWFSITHPFACFLVEKEPWILQVFSGFSSGDELFVQVLLANSPHRKNWISEWTDITDQCMRFILWPVPSPHPYVFHLKNEQALRDTKALFARKFDSQIGPQIISKVAQWVEEG
ncbi:glycosyl transferase [Clostridia bacterium]|nr:glycosyl transferase [Clostridia bacterium]